MASASLAIVETPLQLLCAFEALDRETEGTVILRLTGAGRNDAQTMELAARLGVECLTVNAPVGNRFALLKAVVALRRLMGTRYRAIYLGSYFSRFIRIVSMFFRGRRVFLDDGMATLLSQQVMREKSQNFPLFTFFDVSPLPGQACERHSFSRIRAKFQVNGRGGGYFIGQPLVEKEMLDSEAYKALVETAARDYGNRLSYVPHRTEEAERLTDIRNIPGVQIVEFKSAVEIELLELGCSPHAIYSCCSTALMTLSKLFPESKSVAYMPATLFADSRVRHACEIEQAMLATGHIRVVRC